MTDQKDRAFAYEYMGCHPIGAEDERGYLFRVWAPTAERVELIGDFNSWDGARSAMSRGERGVWEYICPDAREGDRYKYTITSREGERLYKSDPYAFACEPPPGNASVIFRLGGYSWHDREYRARKRTENILKRPINIYEVHLGSWRRGADGSFLSYSDVADELIDYVSRMGFTHIELMPLCEHPYYPSWGYQVTGYHAPTSRYGSSRELMELIDRCHLAGIGVILDWVGAHFPRDDFSLHRFDGSFCYEPKDAIMREQPLWGTCTFDYSKREVRSFLISSAVFWIKEYHFDGIRADAVAAMLYLDYGRGDGEWVPNERGGRENLDAIEFLRELNRAVFSTDGTVIMSAEESTTFPMVTKPDYVGGLGFNLKWNMGWMNDALKYMSTPPSKRPAAHDSITFSLTYAFSENFILPLSHDEVVHGKRSLINKMFGDYDEKFASLRAFYGYMAAHPGKKLIFMGGEFAQFSEWDPSGELDWMLLDFPRHRQMQAYVRALNLIYKETPALWQRDFEGDGFSWIACDDRGGSVIAFRRIGDDGSELVAVFNFSNARAEHYRIGLPQRGVYRLLISSDSVEYGGEGLARAEVMAEPLPYHSLPFSGELTLPPLSALFYTEMKRKERSYKNENTVCRKRGGSVYKDGRAGRRGAGAPGRA